MSYQSQSQPENNDKLSPKDKFNILKNTDLSVPSVTTISTEIYTPVISTSFKKTRYNSGSGKTKTTPTIYDLIEECKKEFCNDWEEPEWGFCKGRRNYKESDYECAIREMKEETGYSIENMKYIKNINPFEETFFGSNYKCYKHKYYLMYMEYEDSLHFGEFEKTEVSCIKWCNYDECLSLIRSYNIEKLKMIANIEQCLNKYILCYNDKI